MGGVDRRMFWEQVGELLCRNQPVAKNMRKKRRLGSSKLSSDHHTCAVTHVNLIYKHIHLQHTHTQTKANFKEEIQKIRRK